MRQKAIERLARTHVVIRVNATSSLVSQNETVQQSWLARGSQHDASYRIPEAQHQASYSIPPQNGNDLDEGNQND